LIIGRAASAKADAPAHSATRPVGKTSSSAITAYATGSPLALDDGRYAKLPLARSCAAISSRSTMGAGLAQCRRPSRSPRDRRRQRQGAWSRRPAQLPVDRWYRDHGNPRLGGAFSIVSSAMPRIEHLGDSLRKIRKPDQVVPTAPCSCALTISARPSRSARRMFSFTARRVAHKPTGPAGTEASIQSGSQTKLSIPLQANP
jgi:hypothetical protein